jgi:hypothetical protein
MTGGNNITVVGECQGKLHAAWDSCLVVKAAGADVAAAATDLMKSITPAKIEEWTHSDPVVWANESFGLLSVRRQNTASSGACPAFLSSRCPSYETARRRPPSVQVKYVTSTTTSGRTQCTFESLRGDPKRLSRGVGRQETHGVNSVNDRVDFGRQHVPFCKADHFRRTKLV